MSIDTLVCSVERTADELTGHAHAMATDITLRAPLSPTTDAGALAAALTRALEAFGEIESACTRFDPESPLMRANAAPSEWHRVPTVLLEVLHEARRAYAGTGGRFDPRVYAELVSLGYDHTLPFGEGVALDPTTGEGVALDPTTGPARISRSAWTPGLRSLSEEVNLGGRPVDLGGIGKGFAVRWAARHLLQTTPDFLVEAGGDCHCAGSGPGGEGWRIGVEDPFGPSSGPPVAVLGLEDRACTTSSTRVRRWLVAGRPVHHLIDPATGRPGGEGLAAVTVVGPEAVMAEVWSKALFLGGSARVEQEAEGRRLAALWVRDDGVVGTSSRMQPYLMWRRP